MLYVLIKCLSSEYHCIGPSVLTPVPHLIFPAQRNLPSLMLCDILSVPLIEFIAPYSELTYETLGGKIGIILILCPPLGLTQSIQ